jgi:DNA topoisomerase-3
VDSLAHQKGLKPPRGYTTSGTACRAFLEQHAPRKDGIRAPIAMEASPPAPARKTVALRHPPDQRKPNPPPAETDLDVNERHSKPGREAVVRKRKASTGKPRMKPPGKAAVEVRPVGAPGGDTPLRIPFGNKDAALQLGARYRAGGWYAPAGVDLNGFRERGWL